MATDTCEERKRTALYQKRQRVISTWFCSICIDRMLQWAFLAHLSIQTVGEPSPSNVLPLPGMCCTLRGGMPSLKHWDLFGFFSCLEAACGYNSTPALLPVWSAKWTIVSFEYKLFLYAKWCILL